MEKELKTETLVYKPTDAEIKRVKHLQERFMEMETAEKEKGLRTKLERFDKLYSPHEYTKTGLKKWQSKTSQGVAFTKIQTAMSVIVEQNPDFSLFPKFRKGRESIPLWKAIIEHINDVGKAKRKLKQFAFNCAKDGVAVGQEYWKKDIRKVKFAKTTEGGKTEYVEQEIEDFNNPYWTNLDRKDVYLDEKAKSWDPLDEHPLRDWFKRIVYDKEGFETRFPEEKYPKARFVKSAGQLANKEMDKTLLAVGKDQYEVLFYENKPKDEFSILVNGVLLKDIPLPYRHKQLSIFGAVWYERPGDIDGIGLCEAIENDESLLDTLVNTSTDQIILDIYKILIVGYGEELEDEEMELEPNKVLRLRDPASAKWSESGRIGEEVFRRIAEQRSWIDEKTGVSKELIGAVPARRQTATESAISREAGLRRMKTPLESIEDAMEVQTRLRIGMIKQIYSIPAKRELQEGGGKMLKYRELRLPLRKEAGKLVPSPREEELMEITPSDLMEEPDIKIKHMSMLPISEALEKQNIMQFYGLIGSHPYTDTYKAYLNICRAWQQDPEEWMKSEKTITGEQQMAKQTMMGMEGVEGGAMGGSPGARQMVPTEGGGTAEVPTGENQSRFKKFFQKLTGRTT